jgi:RNA polymerase sigma factor (sigma-70 family)
MSDTQPTTTQPTTRPPEFDAAVLQWLPFLGVQARRLVGVEQDRDDLVNETVAAALGRWANYEPGRNFAGWLRMQMRERASSMRKQRSVRAVSYDAPVTRSDADGDTFSGTKLATLSTPATQELSVQLSQAVGAMRGRGRDMVLRLAAGDDLRDVAGDYGISRERVRQIAAAERARVVGVANATVT